METLELNIAELKSLLQEILFDVERIDEGNFDQNTRMSKVNIEKVNSLREQLKNNYDIAALRKFDPELVYLAKQIKNSYDNVIRKKKLEAEKVLKDIKTLQNSKKLTSYKR
jgi:hypothetical protein